MKQQISMMLEVSWQELAPDNRHNIFRLLDFRKHGSRTFELIECAQKLRSEPLPDAGFASFSLVFLLGEAGKNGVEILLSFRVRSTRREVKIRQEML
jgi:hypothetical protein